MFHIVIILLTICALVAGLALARLITRWFVDR